MNSIKTLPVTYIILPIVAIGLLGWGARWYVEQQLAVYQSNFQLRIAEQETKLATLAQLVANDGADAVVNQIVIDCDLEDRARFDLLLSNLKTLSPAELGELRGLFDECASFYADRRAFMTARLVREIELFTDYLELLELTDYDATEERTRSVNWNELAEIEKQRSKLMTELVDIQDEIIEMLYAGESIDSEVIKGALAKAQSTKETVFVLTTKADQLRASLSQL